MGIELKYASRMLAVDGLVNARDLGGLLCNDGSVTPSGVFYRSGSIDSVTAAGWEQLRASGIRTIVDLRQPGERSLDSSPRPDWITTVAMDLHGLDGNWEFWKEYWEKDLMGTALPFLSQLKEMPERAGAALSAIVNGQPGGVLFHCVGGRDRCGMITMLLLMVADTDIDEIAEDYLESDRVDAIYDDPCCPDDKPDPEEVCRRFGTTSEEAFRKVVTSLDLDKFLAESGMSPSDQLAFRSWRGNIPRG
ncbi:MAG TPA: tyrosine-protein phosphatase [Streptosporangiaceae bacterium]